MNGGGVRPQFNFAENMNHFVLSTGQNSTFLNGCSRLLSAEGAEVEAAAMSKHAMAPRRAACATSTIWYKA